MILDCQKQSCLSESGNRIKSIKFHNVFKVGLIKNITTIIVIKSKSVVLTRSSTNLIIVFGCNIQLKEKKKIIWPVIYCIFLLTYICILLFSFTNHYWKIWKVLKMRIKCNQLREKKNCALVWWSDDWFVRASRTQLLRFIWCHVLIIVTVIL